MSDYTVIWHKTWDGCDIKRPGDCDHPCGDNLTINQHLEKRARGHGHQIALDADICMICGIDKLGALSLVEGLSRCMDEHGWNRDVGKRLYDLVEFHRADLQQVERVPIWFAHAWGWGWPTIKAALEAAEQAREVRS